MEGGETVAMRTSRLLCRVARKYRCKATAVPCFFFYTYC